MRAERERLRQHFYDVFQEQASMRPRRSGFSTNGRPIWIEMEADAMLAAINKERLARGRPPLSLDRYLGMESGCAGHVDYHTKLALRSMELVFEELP